MSGRFLQEQQTNDLPASVRLSLSFEFQRSSESFIFFSFEASWTKIILPGRASRDWRSEGCKVHSFHQDVIGSNPSTDVFQSLLSKPTDVKVSRTRYKKLSKYLKKSGIASKNQNLQKS